MGGESDINGPISSHNNLVNNTANKLHKKKSIKLHSNYPSIKRENHRSKHNKIAPFEISVIPTKGDPSIVNMDDFTPSFKQINNEAKNNKGDAALAELSLSEKKLEEKLTDLENEPLSREKRIKYLVLMLCVLVFISISVFVSVVYLKNVFDKRRIATDAQDSNFIDFFNSDKNTV